MRIMHVYAYTCAYRRMGKEPRMAQNMKAMEQRINALEETLARMEALLQAQAAAPKQTRKGGRKVAAPKAPKKPELVAFTTKNGEVKYVSQAQADAWNAWRSHALSEAEWEAKKTQWAADRKAYKPSEALIEAIKRDRAAVTRKVAVEKYGFVGTKEDLRALKDSLC